MFRVNVTIEVDQVANALAIATPIPVQLVRGRKAWFGQCDSPPVKTADYQTYEQALTACAAEVAAEVQAAVIDRPVIAGRITPDDIPEGIFR